MTAKVLTGFTTLSDGDIDLAAASAVNGLLNNTNFKLGETYTQLSDAAKVYHDSLGDLATGGKTATIIKNTARTTLEVVFTQVAVIVNQQANGDLVKLESSGIKLVADRGHHEQPMAENLKVKNGDNGAMLVSVDKSPVGDHGTVFAYTPATNPETDPNQWTMKFANAHKTTITGLKPGLSYRFTAAYKGRDEDPLVWAPPISKIVSD